MSSDSRKHFASLEEVRVELVRRLRARRTEIQDAIFARVRALSQPGLGGEHAEYIEGLRIAVIEALDHAVMSIEQGGDWSAPIPSAAASQARRAARSSVSLDTVLRRYAAGDRQMVEFIVEDSDDFPTQELRHLLRMHGLHVDRFMASVAAEYVDELERAARSPEQRLAECVERLLVGEPVDTTKLDYGFGGHWHIGMIAMGPNAGRVLKSVADTIDCQILSIARGEQTVWAWLGSRRMIAVTDVQHALPTEESAGVSLAIGEPAKGLDGWRLTHRQAQAALWVALRKPRPITRYANDLLLAAALRDDVLARSLHDIYFSPLDDKRDGGAVLCETLGAYFAAGRNAATAAAALGVDRHTVQRRLRKIEERLGRLLHTCYAELEVALRLQELGEASDAGSLSAEPLVGLVTDGTPHQV
jgi:hypothetical protein